jgi:hypothetical protein
MKTTKIHVDYAGDVILNNEITIQAPFSMTWFSGVDLPIKTASGEMVFNTDRAAANADGIYVIRPTETDRNLEIIEGVKLQLFRGTQSPFLVVNGKFAFRLPKGVFDIL